MSETWNVTSIANNFYATVNMLVNLYAVGCSFLSDFYLYLYLHYDFDHHFHRGLPLLLCKQLHPEIQIVH